MIERASLPAHNPHDDLPRLSAGAGPMNFRSARLQFCHQLCEVFVQVIDRLPFRFRRRLPGRRVILKRAAGPVPDDDVLPQRRLHHLTMPQILRNAPGVVRELVKCAFHRLCNTSAR